MKDSTINILGVEYKIFFRDEQDDELLRNYDGYTDKTTREIVISNPAKDTELRNFEAYQRKLLRHEVIHAFMFEAGIAESWDYKKIGQEELIVDWFAIQLPKINKALMDAGFSDCVKQL